ncbi:MAG: hypothetical protein ACLFNZ_03135 [Spirochaetaceae bacterium]
MIITEIMLNSLKYAFPRQKAGAIEVSFIREGPEYVLRVRDNGTAYTIVFPKRRIEA